MKWGINLVRIIYNSWPVGIVAMHVGNIIYKIIDFRNLIEIYI